MLIGRPDHRKQSVVFIEVYSPTSTIDTRHWFGKKSIACTITIFSQIIHGESSIAGKICKFWSKVSTTESSVVDKILSVAKSGCSEYWQNILWRDVLWDRFLKGTLTWRNRFMIVGLVLKQLPEHLCYSFLGKDCSEPVIISASLCSDQEKKPLVKIVILWRHKWK